MSAQECRDRADALCLAAQGCAIPGLALQLEATAADWRQMADFARRQDTLVRWLADPANDAASGSKRR